MKTMLLSLVTVLTGFTVSQAQNVNIPDANFKAYLVGNTHINEITQTVVQIYPNPANTVLNVTLENPANIAIVNLLGETLITQTAQSDNNSIDVSLLAAGVYFVRVENNTSIKFVKE